MAKTFISYSRQDQDLAGSIHLALEKRNIDVWIDKQPAPLEGIPPGLEWWKSIEKGILDAAVFIFILTPESITSGVCQAEVAFAVKNGKRLIPLLVVDGDPKLGESKLRDSALDVIREALKKIPDGQPIPDNVDASIRNVRGLAGENWVKLGTVQYTLFNRRARLTTETDRLIKAIQTDWQWLMKHQSYLESALQWSEQGKKTGLLLRGQSLRDAEAWLVESKESDSKNVLVIDLIREFITTSRKMAKRRLLLTIGVAIVLLIILGTAGTYAWNQREIAGQESERADLGEVAVATEQALRLTQQFRAVEEADMRATQQAIAQTQQAVREEVEITATADLRLARSSEMAAQAARKLQEGDLLGAYEDALSAFESNRSADAVYVLADVLNHPLPSSILRGHTGWVSSFSYSPDGRFLLSGAKDGMVKVWNLETGEERLSLEIFSAGLDGIAFSPDSTQIAITDGSLHVYGWSDYAATGELYSIDLSETPMVSLGYSPDSTKLAIGGVRGDAHLYNAETGVLLAELIGHTGWIEKVIFNPDGRTLLTASKDGTARIWDASSGAAIRNLETMTGFGLYDAAFSPDGSFLLTGDGTLDDCGVTCVFAARLYDASSGVLLAELEGTENVYDVTFNEQGDRFAVGRAGQIEVYSLNEGDPVHLYTVIATEPIFVNDDKWLVAETVGNISLFDAAYGDLITTLYGVSEKPMDLVALPDGSQVAMSSWDGEIQIWNTKEFNRENSHLHQSAGGTGAFSPDGVHAALGSYRGIHLWDLGEWSESWRDIDYEDLALNTLQVVTFSQDGQYLLASDFSDLWVWNIAEPSITSTLDLRDPDLNVVGAAISGDASQALLVARGGRGYLWSFAESAAPIPLADLIGSRETLTVDDVHVYEGGIRILASDMDDVKVIEVSSGGIIDVLADIRLSSLLYGATCLSPDGGYVLARSPDDMEIAEVDTGRIISTLTGHEGPVNAWAFSPDGTLLATGSGQRGCSVDCDFSLRVWDVTSGEQRLLIDSFNEPVTALAFNHDGSQIVSGTSWGSGQAPYEDYGLLQIWDSRTGAEDALLGAQQDGIEKLDISPDDQLIMSVSWSTLDRDSKVHLWNANALPMDKMALYQLGRVK